MTYLILSYYIFWYAQLKVGVPQMKHMYHNNNIHNQRVNQMFTGVPSQRDIGFIIIIFLVISWAKAPALYVTMSQEVVDEVHFLDLAVRA